MNAAASGQAVRVRDIRMAYRSASFRSLKDFFSAPSAQPALDGVSFNLAEGEALALIGVNGAGKTTLLKILAGLVLPASGEASVHGVNVLSDPLAAKRLVGFMSSQERSFYWRLTVRQNLEFFAALHGYGGEAARARITELAARVELTDRLDAPFRNLSTGYQQRAGLVRAMLHAPRVLLLDEPTRSLDPAAARLFLDLMARVAAEERLAVLFATHRAQDLPLSHRVCVLRRGAIAWEGTPQQLAEAGKGSVDNGLAHLLGDGGAEAS